MLDINFNPFPVLETERLVLRRWRDTDANDFLFLRSDERVMQYLDRPRLKNTAEALEFIARIQKLDTENEGINWAITLKGSDVMLGTICLFNFAKEHYRGEIGYLLHPDHHGKGLMHEAVAAVLHYGFDGLKLHSIEANVNPVNAASIKVLERHNFVREAYFRENYFFNGKFTDSAIYSLLTPY